jgi:Right handed beta helix region
MNKLVIVIAALLCACGTKQNPRACCTDAADCMNIGLPNGTVCDEGLLCRGNRCVEDPCSSSAECDVAAPYCVKTDEGRCAEACAMDSECPGFGQTAEQTFCVGGGCVECRAGMNDCPTDAPVCSTMGTCVTCELHTDCASGVCASGTCAAENQVAHVALNGSATSDCTRAEPCNTVQRALTIAADRPYVLIAPGTYTSTMAITPTGTRWLIGKEGRPVFTRSTNGPIIEVGGTVDIKLERLEVFGAKGMFTTPRGDGISCGFATGSPKIELLDVYSHSNAMSGLFAGRCAVTATNSEFSLNMTNGVETGEGSSRYDRVTVIGNGATGMFLDEGIHIVINSIIARNTARGIDIYSSSVGNRIEFNTIADNGIGDPAGCAIMCGLPLANSQHGSNLIVRNEEPQVQGGICSYPNSIIEANAGPVKFKHADSAPYDYHIQAGSSAIDLGSVTMFKYDFDGETRPFGAGTDIGADELH